MEIILLDEVETPIPQPAEALIQETQAAAEFNSLLAAVPEVVRFNEEHGKTGKS